MKALVLLLMTLTASLGRAQVNEAADVETCVQAALASRYVYQAPMVRRAKSLLSAAAHLGASTLAPPTLSPGDLAAAKASVTAQIGACLEAKYPFILIQSQIIGLQNQGTDRPVLPAELKNLGQLLTTMADHGNGLATRSVFAPIIQKIVTDSGLQADIAAGKFASVDDEALKPVVQAIIDQVVSLIEADSLVVGAISYFSQKTPEEMAKPQSWAETVTDILN